MTFRWVLTGALALGCADETMTVRVEQAAGFTPKRGAHVSIFGVFKDGRMNEPGWFAIAPKVAQGLREPTCELGYGNRLRDSDPDLAAGVEQLIRDNGIDDRVLDRVAPGAEGELILVLMVYQELPASHHEVTPARPTVRGPGMGGRGGFGRGGYTPQHAPEAGRMFELSGSLFSTAEHHLVAQIDLRYSGQDLDEALDAFVQKLHVVVPDGRCVGWKWNAD